MQPIPNEEPPSEADGPRHAYPTASAPDRISSPPRQTHSKPSPHPKPLRSSPPNSGSSEIASDPGSRPAIGEASNHSPASQPAGPQQTFEVQIARTLPQVEQAWNLLHDTYVQAGYIAGNQHGMHSVPEAVGPHTAVMLGKVDGQAVSTISAIGDNHKGLPLDEVYPDQLGRMRDQGCHLIEVGLLGEKPGLMPQQQRGYAGIFELMRYASYFARAIGATDMVCGIPPRRARLYHRMLGFTQIAQTKTYSTVKGNPVALLKLNLDYVQQYHQRYRGIDYFVRHPIDHARFHDRFRFGFDTLCGSNLGAYLYGQQPDQRPSDQLTADQARSDVSGRIESGRIVYSSTPVPSSTSQPLSPTVEPIHGAQSQRLG